jgi:two-component system response regulator NreC
VSLSVLLAEDHPVVREGLRAMLEAEGDFQVVGQTGNSSEVGGMVEELHPDVLVLDLIMPGIGGLNALRELARRRLPTRVVVLSMYANEAYVLEALQNGAGAYVLKQSEAAELVRGIREVAKGRRYLSPPLSQRAVEAYAKRAKGTIATEEAELTAREKEVLTLVGQGFTSAQIGERLFISVRTVESHRSNLTKKLGLHSQAEMVRTALRRELTPLDPTPKGPGPGAG